MKRKQKVDDRKPTDVPFDSIEQSKFYTQRLLDFCEENGITCIVAVTCYDRLKREDQKHFAWAGSKTTAMGLQMLLATKLDQTIEDEEFDGVYGIDDNGDDGDGDIESQV